jgi:hypothetical protein
MADKLLNLKDFKIFNDIQLIFQKYRYRNFVEFIIVKKYTFSI